MSHRRREGQSAERIVGEKRLVKGTFPHITPFVVRRPLTRPRQPPPRRTPRPARPAPIGSSSCPRARRHHPHRPTPSPRGQRLVHRSAATVPQATVGSGGNHRHLPLQVPDPIHLLLGPLPVTFSMQCPGPPRQSSAGVTRTTPSTTHPVHLWLSGRASAWGRGPWRRRNGPSAG